MGFGLTESGRYFVKSRHTAPDALFVSISRNLYWRIFSAIKKSLSNLSGTGNY